MISQSQLLFQGRGVLFMRRAILHWVIILTQPVKLLLKAKLFIQIGEKLVITGFPCLRTAFSCSLFRIRFQFHKTELQFIYPIDSLFLPLEQHMETFIFPLIWEAKKPRHSMLTILCGMKLRIEVILEVLIYVMSLVLTSLSTSKSSGFPYHLVIFALRVPAFGFSWQSWVLPTSFSLHQINDFFCILDVTFSTFLAWEQAIILNWCHLILCVWKLMAINNLKNQELQ